MGGRGAVGPEFTEEEVVSERIYEATEPPPSPHENAQLHPHSRGISRGQDGSAQAMLAPHSSATAPAPGFSAQAHAVLLTRNDGHSPKVSSDARQTRAKIAEARMKGYEGDPCGGCGAFTLVRNGTCLKCVSCGATSGCS
jgi:ribonucleoside-diphosphate reductase alpha chain